MQVPLAFPTTTLMPGQRPLLHYQEWFCGVPSPRAMQGQKYRAEVQGSSPWLPDVTFRTLSITLLPLKKLAAVGHEEHTLRYRQIKSLHSVGTDFDGCLLAPSHKRASIKA